MLWAEFPQPNFDLSPHSTTTTMGFDLQQVLSDDKHYGPFVCSICNNLVSLDALVTSRCSHPFCHRCLLAWASECRVENKECACPTCKEELDEDPESLCMELGGVLIAAQPLEEAQPLAYLALSLVQVTCTQGKGLESCEWSGDYGELGEHNKLHEELQPKVVPAPVVVEPEPVEEAEAPEEKKEENPGTGEILVQPEEVLPDQPDQKTTRNDDDDDGSIILFQEDLVQPEPSDQSDGDTFVEQQQLSRNLDGEVIEADPAIDEGDEPISMDLLRPPVNSRSKLNDSISSLPSTQKMENRDAPPNMVQRTVSNEKQPPVNKPKRAYKRRNSVDDDLEVSYSHAMDWNTSFNSSGPLQNSFTDGPVNPMQTLEEHSNEGDFELEMSGDEVDPAEDHNTKTLARAEKLKKQANAKFNKGDFNTARSLYTEGIRTMSGITAITTEDQRNCLSNMYSNRAVTYFREKKFNMCIQDCDKAIENDPTYEKSWIRKWRALMARGEPKDALKCLEEGALKASDAKRIEEQIGKASDEMELQTSTQAMIDNGEFSAARDILRPHIRTSDNIGLLFLAARADIGMGNMDNALEKVNKALRFNPSHKDGLELRGYVLFLAGDTEKGAHHLQEAYDRNKDSKKVRSLLTRCHRVHSALSKARACVKRGRYVEATEYFTEAIEESGSLMNKAPLYTMLRTERAEAYLLSKKYLDALKDCQEVILVQKENASAWTVRADILVALGKVEDAKKELTRIRRSWGSDNPTIEEGLRRVDFELRVQKADECLNNFVADLEKGNMMRLLFISDGHLMHMSKPPKKDNEARRDGSDVRRDSNEGRRNSNEPRRDSGSSADNGQKERRQDRKDMRGDRAMSTDRGNGDRRRPTADDANKRGRRATSVRPDDPRRRRHSPTRNPEGTVERELKESAPKERRPRPKLDSRAASDRHLDRRHKRAPSANRAMAVSQRPGT